MTNRNYGIDLLRIVSILMITALHIIIPGMGQNTLYNGTFSIKILYAVCSCGVNCFLLISGYVNLQKDYKISRIIRLILEALFYNITLTIIISSLNNNLSLHRILDSFDILSNNNWWFLKAYLFLFIFMPIINSAINNMTKIESIIVISLIIMCASFITTIKGDIFYLGDGYSPLWFIVVYTIGAFVKKYEDRLLFKKNILLTIYFACIIITVLSFYFLYHYNGEHLNTYILENLLFLYSSPTVLLSGIILLLLFKDLKINNIFSLLIQIVTPSIFPVYLIQCQHYVYKYYFPNFFEFLNIYNNKLFIYIPLITIIITFLLFLVDQIRILLNKILQIDKFFNYIDSKIKIK